MSSSSIGSTRCACCAPTPNVWCRETIGAAGNPPRDASFDFALYAIVLTVLAWIVIPLVVWLAFHQQGG